MRQIIETDDVRGELDMDESPENKAQIQALNEFMRALAAARGQELVFLDAGSDETRFELIAEFVEKGQTVVEDYGQELENQTDFCGPDCGCDQGDGFRAWQGESVWSAVKRRTRINWVRVRGFFRRGE